MTIRTFPGTITSVHDADTLTATLDLGFGLTYRVSIRLQGINGRELAEPGGREARDHLAALAPVGSAVSVVVLGVDKYGGRADARIMTAAGQDVAMEMVNDGYAAMWNGRGPKPVPPWPIPTPH